MYAKTLIRWIALGSLVGVAAGAGSALFLWLLAEATTWRVDHETIVFALPAAGAVIGWLYARFGTSIQAGNNLVIDTIHDAGPEIPLRMFPMVLAGTVLTHLFGGSAGREGTAVQMGASMADWLANRLKLDAKLRRQILAAGVAGGFGSVFGTPIAGTVFGLEFVVLGRIEYDALVPALTSALVGDQVTRGLGIVHTAYPQVAATPLTALLAAKWLAVALAVALASAVFIELTHWLKREGGKRVPQLWLRMAIGGAVVVGLWQLVRTDEYLGLGVPGIVGAFSGHVAPYEFALKLLFTAITLGAGFLGGEVTPLFFIGATLGGALAPLLAIPQPLAAGVCLAAVFGAASNTPLALSIMAVELMGAAVLPHVAIVAVIAYILVGRRSIYAAQRDRVTRLRLGDPSNTHTK